MNHYEVFKDMMATMPSEAQDRVGNTRFFLGQHEMSGMDEQQLSEFVHAHFE